MKTPPSDEAAIFRRAAAAGALPREARTRMRSMKPSPAPVVPMQLQPATIPSVVLAFRSMARCPKCGERRGSAKRTWQVNGSVEWMAYQCGCGFAWCEETAEASDTWMDEEAPDVAREAGS